MAPRGISQDRGFGYSLVSQKQTCVLREKHRIISVAVSLPSAPSSFKELIAIKITEIYNALRSGWFDLAPFPLFSLTHSPAL